MSMLGFLARKEIVSKLPPNTAQSNMEEPSFILRFTSAPPCSISQATTSMCPFFAAKVPVETGQGSN